MPHETPPSKIPKTSQTDHERPPGMVRGRCRNPVPGAEVTAEWRAGGSPCSPALNADAGGSSGSSGPSGSAAVADGTGSASTGVARAKSSRSWSADPITVSSRAGSSVSKDASS